MPGASPPPLVPGRVSVIVVSYNCAEHLPKVLASLRASSGDVQAVVVDNASVDGSAEIVARGFPEAVLLALDENLGFAEGNNRGVAMSDGEHLLLLNPDAWVEVDTIGRLAAALQSDPTLGVVGGTVRHPDGTVQELGNRLDRLGFPVPRRAPPEPGEALPLRDTFFVGGCALMTRRRDWDRLGGLDGRYLLFCEELDYCWRVQRAGGDIGVVPNARVWHHGGVTLAGGYAREGRHRTSPARVYLRERNTLASVIKNGSAATLAWAALAWGMNTVEALGFLALGQPGVAAQYPRALWWNLRELPETLRERRRLAPARLRADAEIRGWARGSGKLRVLRAGGVPLVERAA